MTQNRRRILVVDDEESIRRVLRASLIGPSADPLYQVYDAENVKEAEQLLIERRPELVILDLALPDGRGIDVLKRLREWSTVPVIILSAQDGDSEKVEALDAGADDYVTKPFSTTELLARVRAALRHAYPDQASPRLIAGPIELDLSAHTAKVNVGTKTQVLQLTQTEYEILKILVKNAGKVVTHRVLLREIWGPNSVEHTQYLRVYVGQLRKKLGTYGIPADLIATETGIGYRFNDDET